MKQRRIPVPRHLQADGRALWKRLTTEFRFDDGGSLELLDRACVAADRASQARAIIARDGLTVATARGLQKHPAAVLERESVETLVRVFKLLGLHHAPDGPGRRTGS